MPVHKSTHRARQAPRRNRPWRLGSRASPLALAQAEEVRARLCAAHGLPPAAITIVPVIASGDRIADRPLAEIGGKALWTKELDAWLAEGAIDFAVHSAKDVETLRPPEFALVAVPPRADVRDVLVVAAHITASGIAALPQGARLGTSAPRRAAQLLHLRPDLRILPLRGNVATRLARLAAGEVDATLLAAAGLGRLGQAGIGHTLEAPQWLPAPGQGALLVEARAADDAALALLAAITHAPSHTALLAERALLAALGGTCHSAVAALTQPAPDGRLHLTAALFSPDGRHRIAGEIWLAPGDTTAPAALAADLLARAPAAITRHFAGPPA